jgi:YVTN family beta-propeller protein
MIYPEKGREREEKEKRSSIRPLPRKYLAPLAIAALVAAMTPLSALLTVQNSYAMGPPGSACTNRYDGTITSLVVNNGTKSYDIINDHVTGFDARVSKGYSATIKIHFPAASSQNNTSPGQYWFWSDAYGVRQGSCNDGGAANSDTVLNLPNIKDAFITDDLQYHQGIQQVQYYVHWSALAGDVDAQYSVQWINDTGSTAVSSSNSTSSQPPSSSTSSSSSASPPPSTLPINPIFSAIGVGLKPGAIAVNSAMDKVYVSNGGSSSVSVIDGSSDRVVVTIPTGNDTFGIAANPNTSKVYVANSGAISVIDSSSNTVIKSIKGVGTLPSFVAINPQTNKVYVTGEDIPAKMYVIDGQTDNVTGSIALGGRGAVAVNQNTNTIYAFNGVNAQGQPVISAIDGNSKSITANITLPGQSVGFPIAVDEKANRIYVADTAHNSAYIIDGSTNKVVATVPISGIASVIAANSIAGKAYAANSTGVVGIDGSSGSVTNFIPLQYAPTAIAANTVTSKVYVAAQKGPCDYGAGVVYVLNATALNSPTPVTSPPPLPPEDCSQLQVFTDYNGSSFNGANVSLSQGGVMVHSSISSPATFALQNGEQYMLSVPSKAGNNYVFDHWNDGASSATRSISIQGATTIYAIYKLAASSSSTGSISTTISQSGSGSGSTSGSGSGSSSLQPPTQPPSSNPATNPEPQPPSEPQLPSAGSGNTSLNPLQSSNPQSQTPSSPSNSSPTTTASSGTNATTITVHAMRIPSQYWAPTFVEAGAQMYFYLENSTGAFLQSVFADERGYTFTGLQPGQNYFLVANDCYHCHGGQHIVHFVHWEDGTTNRVRELTTGANASAFFEFIPPSGGTGATTATTSVSASSGTGGSQPFTSSGSNAQQGSTQQTNTASNNNSTGNINFDQLLSQLESLGNATSANQTGTTQTSSIIAKQIATQSNPPPAMPGIFKYVPPATLISGGISHNATTLTAIQGLEVIPNPQAKVPATESTTLSNGTIVNLLFFGDQPESTIVAAQRINDNNSAGSQDTTVASSGTNSSNSSAYTMLFDNMCKPYDQLCQNAYKVNASAGDYLLLISSHHMNYNAYYLLKVRVDG